jgi:hypothetical protein
VTGVFDGSLPNGYVTNGCNRDACCSSPTSCNASNYTPGDCPGFILTKQ